MTNNFVEVDVWQVKPLCCRYFSVHFKALLVQVLSEGGSLSNLTVTWALGALLDGGCEVLGAWPVSTTGATFWRGVFDELQIRGVKKISLLSVDEPLDSCAAFPYATELPHRVRVLNRGHAAFTSANRVLVTGARLEVLSIGAAQAALEHPSAMLRGSGAAFGAKDRPEVLMHVEALYALAPRHRRILRQAGDAANELSLRLGRAVARHGWFSNPAAASSFVVDRLTRAERDLCALGVDVFPGPARPVARTIRRPGIAAPGV